jgi:hypothetical protein
MTVCSRPNRNAKVKGRALAPRNRGLLIGAVALVALGIAFSARAQTAGSGTTPFDQAVGLATAPNTPLPRLVVDCATIDPAKIAAQSTEPSLDRPSCAALSAPLSPQTSHELIKLTRADVSVSLGLTGGSDQGFDLMRALAQFSHFLNAGPLGGWKLGAEAQLGRPPDLESTYLVDERVRLSLTPPELAGWNLRFDAGAVTQGGFDPATAKGRTNEVSADLSRSFVMPGSIEPDSIHLRLAADTVQEWLWGSDRDTNSATFGYTHAITAGSIGTEFVATRPFPLSTGAAINKQVEVKFTRPF